MHLFTNATLLGFLYALPFIGGYLIGRYRKKNSDGYEGFVVLFLLIVTSASEWSQGRDAGRILDDAALLLVVAALFYGGVWIGRYRRKRVLPPESGAMDL